MKKRAEAKAEPQARRRRLDQLVRIPGVFCCWIHATRCNFIGPEKTCKLGELGECPHKFIKPNPSVHRMAHGQEKESGI